MVPSWACPTACLLWSLTVEVSLCWVSRFQVGSATPALSQEAKDDGPGPSYYIPAVADAGTVLRCPKVAVITKAIRAI